MNEADEVYREKTNLSTINIMTYDDNSETDMGVYRQKHNSEHWFHSPLGQSMD